MFDSIRSHRRWLMFFMLVLIFPSLSSSASRATTALFPAKVRWQRSTACRSRSRNSTSRSASVSSGCDSSRTRVRSEDAGHPGRPRGDPRWPDHRSRAVAGSGTGNLIVTNDQLRRVLANAPAFQEDNKFSLERYRAYVAAQGLSEQQFENACAPTCASRCWCRRCWTRDRSDPGDRPHRSCAA